MFISPIFQFYNSEKKVVVVLTALLLSVPGSFAQKNTVIPIETSQNALVIQTDNSNHPGIIYFGKKMSKADEYGYHSRPVPAGRR